MNLNEELYELENYEGSGFSSFLKDQSKKLIKKAGTKAVEKAVNRVGTAGGEKIGELIANKIIPSSSSSNQNFETKNQNNIPEIPIDSGYKIIKLLKKNQPVDNIRKQFISI